MVRSAAVTMEETKAGVGVGLAATTHVLSGPRVSLGNSGGQTVQRLLGRPLQLVRGRVPAASMKISELIEKIELRVGRHPEAHLMAFALLVVLAHEAPEGGTALVLAEAGVVVVVEDEFAGEGEPCLKLCGRPRTRARHQVRRE